MAKRRIQPTDMHQMNNNPRMGAIIRRGNLDNFGKKLQRDPGKNFAIRGRRAK